MMLSFKGITQKCHMSLLLMYLRPECQHLVILHSREARKCAFLREEVGIGEDMVVSTT